MLYPSIAKSFLAFWAAARDFGLDLAEGGGKVGFFIGDFEGIISPRNFLLFTCKVTKNIYIFVITLKKIYGEGCTFFKTVINHVGAKDSKASRPKRQLTFQQTGTI